MIDFSQLPSLLVKIGIHLGEAILVFAADPRVLPEPALSIGVRTLGENGVELLARPFVKSGDYFAVKGDLVERIKLQFDQERIPLAVPQRDVRVVTHDALP